MFSLYCSNLFPFPLPHLQHLHDFEHSHGGCVAETFYPCGKYPRRWGSFSFQCLTGVDCKYEQHGGCLIRSGNCLPFQSTWVHPRFVRWGWCCSSFCFVCLCPVSCVPSVASLSGLSTCDCHFRFSLTFIC